MMRRLSILLAVSIACGCAQSGIGDGEDVRSDSEPDMYRPVASDMSTTTGDLGTTPIDVGDTGFAGDAPGDLGITNDASACATPCGETEVCQDGTCVDLCGEAAAECGLLATSELGEVDCGACATGQVCDSNACIDPCAIVDAECGPLPWNDDVVECGDCSGSCEAGQCIASGYLVIDGGFAHTCAVTSEGVVDCWGENDQGEAGTGTGDSSTPAALSGVTGATSVSSFNMHSCAGQPAGAWCWGLNGLGQIGDGTTLPRPSPTSVSSLNDVTQVVAGGGHSCALTTAGTVYCWGANQQGQLGIGNIDGQRESPVQVPGLTDVVELAAGSVHTCARLADGTVTCWGWNADRQLGNSSQVSPRPTTVEGLDPAIAIATGSKHSCAVTRSNEVYCWGAGTNGELGTGANASSATPVRADVTGALDVFAGASHTCAVRDDLRRLWCWGDNSSGQLGINNMISTNSPIQVLNLTNVVGGGAGYAHTCATRDDGTAWCWGANDSGQLGDGSTSQRLAPARVGN